MREENPRNAIAVRRAQDGFALFALHIKFMAGPCYRAILYARVCKSLEDGVLRLTVDDVVTEDVLQSVSLVAGEMLPFEEGDVRVVPQRNDVASSVQRFVIALD